ncbi:MAG: DUF3109 family protein [Bacteroidales bacterium]|jgi:hypothetical protein|nr:DUF3109 family protein [Bacteroidales bacterium]
MFVVGKCIVSEDIKDIKFCCDIPKCKGSCCIEGDCGAPLKKQEIKTIEEILPIIKPYIKKESWDIIEQRGFFEKFPSQDIATSIINGKDCVFLFYDEKKIAKCAIEKAFEEGKIPFKKPISCHLYPLRVQDYGEFLAINYHKWSVCKDALVKGKKEDKALYKILEEPLKRAFGKKWYEELVLQIESK